MPAFFVPRHLKDSLAGGVFMLCGLVFAWGARAYPLGTSARMGPGYFPFVLGLALALVGALLLVQASVRQRREVEPLGPWAWRPLLCVLGANIAFGVLLAGVPAWGWPPMGLVPAVVVLTVLASLGAGPLQTFFRVTLPVIAPGVISGALFAFATSFDEVVVTLFLAGPTQATLPRQMFTGIRENISPTIAAVATLLILFTACLMMTLEWLRGRVK